MPAMSGIACAVAASYGHGYLTQVWTQRDPERLGLAAVVAFDLLDAILTADGLRTLARLSQALRVPRRWPSFPDALTTGTIAVPALPATLPATLPPCHLPVSWHFSAAELLRFVQTPVR